ncbi:hypothetical protein V474_07895 [Novosphingobium barchaimii LL02]|uniref:Uncharacterized protein n=2 Tax=Novosphingobium barchaimii TaxID=1420591 RepID=A0A0J7Y7W0_9SPHN|nr:hypothetical protein V474_07895 [Novosphingobium barchaimii LL02]
MSSPDTIAAIIRDLEQMKSGQHEPPPPPTLPPSQGDGNDGGMERRINTLEGKVDKLVDRTVAIEVGIATLTERMAHLPSKEYLDDKFGKMLTRTGIMVAIIGGIVGLAVRFIPA